LDKGCTVFNGKGGYTGKENCVILTVLTRSQFIKLKQFIKNNDPDAFVTVNDTSEVLGKGFKSLAE
ncbi:MAG: YitT family protein, partial [Clostridium sp.]|nr:YitT family protein [Clostridium sp.]